MVLSNDIFGGASEEEVNVEVTTSCDIAKDILIIFFLYNRGLCVRASEEDTKELVRGVRLNENEWMHTMQLLSSKSTVVLSHIF